MSLNRYIFLLFFTATLAMSSAQSPLDVRVSLHVENLPLEETLYRLIDQPGVRISFSNSILPANKLVSAHFDSVKLKHVLTHVLAGAPLDFRVVGAQVVLVRKKETPTKRKFTLSGYVRDQETGERVIGAVIYDLRQTQGAYSNEFGFFSLTLPEDVAAVVVSNLGYEADTLPLRLEKNQHLEVALKPLYLAEVVVQSFTDSILLQTKGGVLLLNMEQAAKLSSLGGESDVVRMGLTLPGVQAGADGFGGVSVRGGDIDQNLFLLDGVPVYNVTHGAGIFSIYNSSAIRSAQLLKGGFPAQYGGRISSVWDIQTKEGNSNQMQGELDLGLTSGKLTWEGPLKKEKGSFFVSGRRAFFDFYSIPFTTRLRRKEGVDGYTGYFFYDLNAKVNYQVSPKDRVYLSFYRGRDDYQDIYEQSRTSNDTVIFVADNEQVGWGNDIASLRWNHQFSDRLFGNLLATYSRYFYNSEDFIDLEILDSNRQALHNVLLFKYDSEVKDQSVKADFDYATRQNHFLRFGLSATRHRFQPGVLHFSEEMVIDSILTDTLGDWQKRVLESVELDAYLQDEFHPSDFITLNLGLRASALAVDGTFHFSPQPRLLVRFFEKEKLSFSASAGRMTQFLHLLSPNSIGLPKDLWVSATRRVPPQHSWQFAGGVHRKLGNGIEASVEGYYKTMRNLLNFSGSGLDSVDFQNWQDLVSIGTGWAYGLEFLLKKESGKFGGWLSYTLGWTERKFGAEINGGESFPHRLDRRHNLNLQLLYKLGKRWDFSSGFTYASGSAFTFPSQEYDFILPSGIITHPLVIDELNGFRLPAYHRLDFSVNYLFSQRKARHTLILGVYNAYNRKNPFFVTLRNRFTDDDKIFKEPVQVSLLPVFPTLRYTIEFK